MDATNGQIVKAGPIEIRPNARTADVFHQIMLACQEQVTVNARLLPELRSDALHQTRIGLRRTRSALALFKKQLDPQAYKPLNTELRRLGRILSVGRDWDVFLQETLPEVNAYIKLDVGTIRELADAHRHAAYQEACREIDNDRLMGLADTFSSIGLSGEDSDDPIRETVPDLLSRQARKVKRRSRHIETPEQQHALRKAMKKLRYSVEFLSSLYDSKDVKSYLERCKETQDKLGKVNDAHTTLELCTQLKTDQPIDSLIEWAKRQDAHAESHLTIAKFRSAKPFWQR